MIPGDTWPYLAQGSKDCNCIVTRAGDFLRVQVQLQVQVQVQVQV